MSVGRNASCPCGSGSKFKHCCANKSSRGMSKGLMALLAVIAAIAAIGLAPALFRDDPPRQTPQQVAAPRPEPKPQPAGEAPPGKVWSPEHGHWHDAAPATQAASPIRIDQSTGPAQATGNTAPIAVSMPQPPGDVPPGKVWSPEHGHWHDAPKQ